MWREIGKGVWVHVPGEKQGAVSHWKPFVVAIAAAWLLGGIWWLL